MLSGTPEMIVCLHSGKQFQEAKKAEQLQTLCYKGFLISKPLSPTLWGSQPMPPDPSIFSLREAAPLYVLQQIALSDECLCCFRNQKCSKGDGVQEKSLL